MSSTCLLRMRGITKRFPGVTANDGVDIDVAEGEILALLGENGAGKSTLMKILYGLQRPDAGTIEIGGEPVELRSPAAAISHRIGMIHQHFMLVDTLSVAENVTLGTRHRRRVRADRAREAALVDDLAERYDLDVDPSALIWQLSVGERQRVEILKALYRDARLLVLDEPTAVLTPQEVDSLFVTLRRMADDGRGLIFISHKLHEVEALAHRVTVLRDGRVVGSTSVEDTTLPALARMMVGRELNPPPVKLSAAARDVRLALCGVCVIGDRGHLALDGVDLEIHRGEILGLAGVSGNGQRELAEVICGLRTVDSGSIEVDGRSVIGLGPAEVRKRGVGYVPEERMRDGAIGTFSVAENLMLVDIAERPFSRGGLLDHGAIESHSTALVERFDVKTASTATPIGSLSGGNIQKVILARELAGDPGVLIAAQPTRGVDVGAGEHIRGELVAQRALGMATLLISEDLDEILELADRVAVICDGRITGIVDPMTTTPEAIGLLMAGVADDVDDGNRR